MAPLARRLQPRHRPRPARRQGALARPDADPAGRSARGGLAPSSPPRARGRPVDDGGALDDPGPLRPGAADEGRRDVERPLTRWPRLAPRHHDPQGTVGRQHPLEPRGDVARRDREGFARVLHEAIPRDFPGRADHGEGRPGSERLRGDRELLGPGSLLAAGRASLPQGLLLPAGDPGRAPGSGLAEADDAARALLSRERRPRSRDPPPRRLAIDASRRDGPGARVSLRRSRELFRAGATASLRVEDPRRRRPRRGDEGGSRPNLEDRRRAGMGADVRPRRGGQGAALGPREPQRPRRRRDAPPRRRLHRRGGRRRALAFPGATHPPLGGGHPSRGPRRLARPRRHRLPRPARRDHRPARDELRLRLPDEHLDLPDEPRR